MTFRPAVAARVAASSALALAILLNAASLSAADATAYGDLTPAQQTQVQFHIMAGELAAGRDQPGVAAQAFLEALKLQPDAQLASRATQLALISGDGSLALATARQWLTLEPSSLDAREVIALLALRQGDLDEVYAQSLEVIRGHAAGPTEGFRHIALLLSGEPGRGDPVRIVMDRLIGQYPELPGARYARALTALRFEDFPLAERSAREALKLEPDSRDYKLLLVGVLVRTSQLDESDRLVDELLAKPSERDEMRMTYAKLLLEAGEREPARVQLRKALADNAENRDARYALGVLAFNDNELDEAEKMFLPLVTDTERSDDVHYQLGRIAESRKQYEAALGLYAKVDSGAQAVEAAVRSASVLSRLDRVDEARASLAQLRRQLPPLAARLTQAEAEILMDVDRNDDALGVYMAALEVAPENLDLLYGRSLVLDRLGRFSDSEKDLRAILDKRPDDSRALNALGYLLTVNTERYDEAFKLISQAIEKSPDDAAVIDSMGWVLFKLGRPLEALPWLEKALAQASDPEISAHLGEVLWVLGEQDQARAIWDKARARDPDHPGLAEVIERLTR